MKFKDMSWEELQKDFSKILDQYTTDELVESLEKYRIEPIKYKWKKPKLSCLGRMKYNTSEEIKVGVEYSNIKNNIDKKENIVWERTQELLVA